LAIPRVDGIILVPKLRDANPIHPQVEDEVLVGSQKHDFRRGDESQAGLQWLLAL
jgi:hypothetical protein